MVSSNTVPEGERRGAEASSLVHERRASKRVEASLQVHYTLEVPDQPEELWVKGDTKTINIGTVGALLKWSAWWKCAHCPHAVELDRKPPCGLGMCQFTALDDALSESSRMELDITLPPPAGTVRLYGRIVWIRKPGRRRSGSVAVEFVSVPAAVAAKLEEFVESRAKDERAAAPPGAAHRLIVTSGPLEGTEFVLEKKAFTIGRSQENDLALPNLRVSREHAVLRIGGDGVMIHDLGSTNGTYVNGERITKRLLHNDDKISIGPISLVFKTQKVPLGVAEPSGS